MKVRDAFRPRGAHVTPADSLGHAARVMRSTGLGCLPVLESNSVVGILTERDLVEAAAREAPVAKTCVGGFASDGSVTVSLADDCAVAELKMLAIGCRNLPVVDGKRLVGTISMRDVILKVPPQRVISTCSEA